MLKDPSGHDNIQDEQTACSSYNSKYPDHITSGIGLMVREVGLGSEDPEFKSHSVVESIPGGVDSACHSFEVGKMSVTSQLAGILHWSGDLSGILPNIQRDCLGL